MVNKWVLSSSFFLCLGLFTSTSVTALHHILMVPALKFGKNFKFLSKAHFFWCFLAFVSFISLLPNIEELGKVKYFVMGGILPIIYKETLMKFSGKTLSFLFQLLMISALVATLVGLLAIPLEYNILRFRAPCHLTRNCGMYGMYMTYGYGIVLYLLVLLGLWKYFDRLTLPISRNFLLFNILVQLVGLISSGCRGAYIGFICALPFYLKRNQLKFFLGSLLVVGPLVYQLPQVKELIHNKRRMKSVDQRFALYKASYYAAVENPLLGLGFKRFEENSLELKKKYDLSYKDFKGHAHSNLFEHLASTGILGLLALILFHFYWFLEGIKRKDFFGRVSVPFNVCLFVSGLFQYTLGDGENMFLITNFFALGQASMHFGELTHSKTLLKES